MSVFIKNPELILFSTTVRALGGVYVRKLAPARVSYRDDFFYFVSRLHYDWVISYLVI